MPGPGRRASRSWLGLSFLVLLLATYFGKDYASKAAGFDMASIDQKVQ